MTESSHFEKLFFDQLRKIHNAENQIIKALPMMINKAYGSKLKSLLKYHYGETNNQVYRLDEIGKAAGISLKGEHCEGMETLITEVRSSLLKEVDKEFGDVGLIAAIRRIEHYEIAAYDTAASLAEAIPQNDFMKRLKVSQKEEIKMDKKLRQLTMDAISIKPKIKPKPVLN